ncbi:MAG: hypothetical protein COT17_03175 [Elusimicrobia bacterium CG08_land_8_20_14_0_20_51_18]|nr:MAG: hypothetical protein COT17_03175 [Elusimicrobia bacterium CG08_land_8_20_14_0_20_51_18]
MIEKELGGFKVLLFEKLRDENVFCCLTTKVYRDKPVFDMRRENISKKTPLFRKFLEAAGAERYFYMRQAHTSNINVFEAGSAVCAEGDAAATSLKKSALLGFSADCSLSLFYDRRNRALAVCHAGWKGALLNIYENLFRRMHLSFGTRKEDLFVGAGPCISAENYPVKKDLADKFFCLYGKTAGRFFRRRGGECLFSLEAVLKYQLKNLGIKEYEFSNLCTYEERELLYSHRRGDEGRFAMCAMLNK